MKKEDAIKSILEEFPLSVQYLAAIEKAFDLGVECCNYGDDIELPRKDACQIWMESEELTKPYSGKWIVWYSEDDSGPVVSAHFAEDLEPMLEEFCKSNNIKEHREDGTNKFCILRVPSPDDPVWV